MDWDYFNIEPVLLILFEIVGKEGGSEGFKKNEGLIGLLTAGLFELILGGRLNWGTEPDGIKEGWGELDPGIAKEGIFKWRRLLELFWLGDLSC